MFFFVVSWVLFGRFHITGYTGIALISSQPPILFERNEQKMEKSIPVYEGPVDHLRYGFKSLETQTSAAHPVAQLQLANVDAQWAAKLDMVRRTYGSHLAMRLATERTMFGRQHRLPGLQSSHVGLDTVTGSDVNIDFSDYLSGT